MRVVVNALRTTIQTPYTAYNDTANHMSPSLEARYRPDLTLDSPSNSVTCGRCRQMVIVSVAGFVVARRAQITRASERTDRMREAMKAAIRDGGTYGAVIAARTMMLMGAYAAVAVDIMCTAKRPRQARSLHNALLSLPPPPSRHHVVRTRKAGVLRFQPR